MSPEWLTALLTLAIVVGGLLTWATRWAWRLLRRTGHFLDDWAGQPAHDGLEATPGVMARLHGVEELVAKILHETTPNGGGNMRDAIRLIARDVAEIKSEQAEVRRQLEHRQLEGARKEGQHGA
jgi:hypothetical protein